VAVALGGGIMSGFAVLLLVFRRFLPALYSDSAEVIALSAALIPIAAAFQLVDGVQVVGAGVLRGMGKTRPAAVFNAVGYYALALPIGYWLAFHAGLGLVGIWWGLCAGLAAVAVLLVFWIRVRGPARVDARVV
jgi:MATE family multidrug resistance protein